MIKISYGVVTKDFESRRRCRGLDCRSCYQSSNLLSCLDLIYRLQPIIIIGRKRHKESLMSDEPIQLPFISAVGAEGELRRIATEETENLLICDHAILRMVERGVTRSQIIKTVKLGDMVDKPKWCTEKEKGWRCKFRRINAGTKITAIAKLIKRDKNLCLIVTSWEE